MITSDGPRQPQRGFNEAASTGRAPVAIVGIGCRFAGAPDLHAFWEMTLAGRDAFGPPPADRWPHEAFYDPNPRAKDKSYAPAGGFIQDIRSFPAIALGIPPRRVEVMDPQQRLALEVALEATQDAGLLPRDLPERTGVYMGVTASEYKTLSGARLTAQLMASGVLGDAPDALEPLAKSVARVAQMRPFTAPGLLANMVSATIAQELHCRGPAFTTDAACASAMVSIGEAVISLRAGAIDCALAGGVYVCITPEHHIAFSRIGAMSKQGRCLPFDAAADGFVQGDGCGVLVLKRLADAARDGDRVYAVLEGLALNNDGGGDGPMAPVQAGQIACVEAAWADSGLDRRDLGYIEAHGTGTQVGDRVELEGLAKTFAATSRQGVVLGSAKANVGHTMSAAGVAGVIRATLAIHHRTLPPMAGFNAAKPELGLDTLPFVVPTEPSPWTDPRPLAAVSSFGFGGTNGHIVLRAPAPAPQETAPRPQLVLLSAPDEASLRDLAARTAAAIDADPAITVAGVAQAWATRDRQPARLAIVATTPAELAAGLRNPALLGVATTRPRVAFLYPGQGSQRVGMIEALKDRFPTIAETLRAVDTALDISVSDLLYPQRRDAAAEARLTATENCQPALYAVGAALTRLLRDANVIPDQVCGHSVGEFCAAEAAHALSLPEGARWTRARGVAMAQVQGDHGAMAALVGPIPDLEALLVPGAVVANLNHPRQAVVSGATEAVAEVVARTEAAGFKAVPLEVSHAFHSPLFQDLDLDATIDALALDPPRVPLISCITDGAYANTGALRAAWKAHAQSPVNFSRALQRLDADVYLQVGAGGPLLAFARGVLGRSGGPYIPLASRDDADGERSLLTALGQLFVAGVDVNSRAVNDPALVASVPPRVLPRQDYWIVRDQRTTRVALTAAQARAPVEAAPAPEPAVPEPTAQGIAQRVLEAVAQASAYPVSALRPDMRLAEDLGFDSMMLAELTTELVRVIPGLDGIPQELLVGSPKIGDLIAYAESPSALSSTGAADDTVPLARFRAVWRRADPPAQDAPRDAEVLRFVFDAAPVSPGAVLSGERARPAPEVELLDAVAVAALRGQQPDLLVLCRDEDPFAEGLAGAVRAISAEWPDAVCKCVRASTEVFDPAILDAEWASRDRTVDIRFTAEGRFVRAFEPLPPLTAAPLAASEVVLVTGGTRGIGAKLSDAFEAAGATVIRVGRAQADVTDPVALTSCVDGRPVTTLIHAAGLLADGPIGSVSPRQAQACRMVKVDGLIHAIAACGPSLRRVVALGSWAGAFGNRHQADYSAANALMSGIVAALPPQLNGVSIELPPWTDSDMVQAIPEPIRAAMRAEGVDFVADQTGMEALREELTAGSGVVIRGRRIPTALRQVREQTALDVATHPYLQDHAIDGKPVLPLVSAASLMADAVGLVAPFVLQDLTLFQSVTAPAALEVRAHRDQIELFADGALAYRAHLGPLGAPHPSLRPGGDPPTLSLAEFYAAHTFHGPLLQGITAIDAVGPGFVRGHIRPGRRAEWTPADPRDWRVDPLALDSALQLSGYVALTQFGRAGTPVGIRRLVQLAPLPDQPLVAQVTFDPGESDRFEGEVSIWTEDGALLLVAEGVSANLQRLDASPALADPDLASGDPDAPSEAALEGFEAPPEWTTPSAWPEFLAIKARQDDVARLGLQNPYFDLHEGTARDTTQIAGRTVINYSSYNYLGLSGDPRIIAEVHAAMQRYGTSVSASRVASGERPFHGALERGLAAAQGADAALVFASGHATNVTVIGHLFGPKDLILHDELIHDSCLQGIRLSGAARRGFRHDDPEHLAAQLRTLRSHYQKVLILIEGVYSMDGDIAKLPDYVALKEQWGCLLMVDEAHSFGTIGKTGCGIGEHYGVSGERVDLWMGTLSKSLASMGGWIAGSAALIEYLRYTTPGFVFAAGQPPTLGQASLSALRIMHEEPWRVSALQHNSQYFYEQLAARGVNTGDALGRSPVIPVITRDSAVALVLSERLLDQGINAKPIIFPAVAEDAARLRFFLTAVHTEEQLAYTAQTIAQTLGEARAQLGRPQTH